ncbi:unnamed protein product [Lota lota]
MEEKKLTLGVWGLFSFGQASARHWFGSEWPIVREWRAGRQLEVPEAVKEMQVCSIQRALCGAQRPMLPLAFWGSESRHAECSFNAVGNARESTEDARENAGVRGMEKDVQMAAASG